MSLAYNNKRKEARRKKDLENPERVRIRRLIRKGILPRYYFGNLPKPHGRVFSNGWYKGVNQTGQKVRIYLRWPILKSTFWALTKGEKPSATL